ncbi:myb domain protein 73 [Actinidia rufa]|uniref:Myb domain protein 73 n=1 Tax=Actinidia rufa TaxID=165716 RepID=A0A7J0EKR9_9ERIC|nr:myb domain protein 73 [Actinidia rufa]
MEGLHRSSSTTPSSCVTTNRAERIKGPWSAEEDKILTLLVNRYGPRNWYLISKSIKGRSGKSCRLRWCNQLSPNVEHRPFSQAEDKIILAAHARYSNKWATIARLLSGRTDIEVKNHWNSTLKRRLVQQPRMDGGYFVVGSSSGSASVGNAKFDPMTTLSLAPPGVSGGTAAEGRKTEGYPAEVWDALMVVIAREVREYLTSSFPEASSGFR